MEDEAEQSTGIELLNQQVIYNGGIYQPYENPKHGFIQLLLLPIAAHAALVVRVELGKRHEIVRPALDTDELDYAAGMLAGRFEAWLEKCVSDQPLLDQYVRYQDYVYRAYASSALGFRQQDSYPITGATVIVMKSVEDCDYVSIYSGRGMLSTLAERFCEWQALLDARAAAAAVPGPVPEGALAAVPPPAPEPPPPPRCWFCEEPAVPPGPPSCGSMRHTLSAWSHQERLERGGLVDCPGTRAETSRFVDSRVDEAQAQLAESAGYRSHFDNSAPVAPSLPEQRPPPPEEIPLVGATPHYEWP